MTHFLNCTKPNVTSELRRMGLNEKAIYKIFFGPFTNPPLIDLMPGTPTYISQNIRARMLASGSTFRSIPTRQLCMPNVWTGEPMATDIGFATPSPPEVPYPMFPLFYYFLTSEDQEFWLVSFDPMSVITQIIIPSIDIMLFVGDLDFAHFILKTFREHESRFGHALASRSTATRPKTVGLVDQLPNYAHQLINHLTGLELLIENGYKNELDEIWIVGIEFFGRIEAFYPSLANKIRRFSSRDHVSDLLLKGHYMPYRLGCGVFRRRLRTQIIKRAAEHYKVEPRLDHFPLIGITLREQNRRCINLEDVVCHLVSRLSHRYPKLALVLDGWVRPENIRDEDEIVRNTPLSNAPEIINKERQVAERLVQELPRNMVIRNLIGMPILQSIIGIADIDIYLSHVGTLQHKLGFFSCSTGVVHGPTYYMINPNPLQFSSEVGTVPTLLPDSAVIDRSNNKPARHPVLWDYEITNTDQVVSMFKKLLALR